MEDNRYKTKDLQLAATLQALGHKVEAIETIPDVKSRYFVFADQLNEEGKSVLADAVAYADSSLKVEPNKLFRNHVVLREWVRQEMSGQYT